MAVMLVALAEYEREILREQVRAGQVHAWHNGSACAAPTTAAAHADEVQ